MKRSIALLISNVLATAYSVYLLVAYGGAIIEAGGAEFVEAIGSYFKVVFELFGTSSSAINFMYAVVALLCVHVVVFVLGSLIGWIAFACKKSGGAKFAATLYLIGTICFPIYLFFGLPITIAGFVGGGNQKKINAKQKQAAAATKTEAATE